MPSPRRSAKAKPVNEAAIGAASGAASGAANEPKNEAPAEAAKGSPRVLKKYPNRRLYDTRSSSYITLADVKQMVLEGEHFEVRDAKTSEDLTRTILLQIILDEETGGMPMFTTPMLSHIIRFYGHAMQSMMGAHLENNLQTFVELQQRYAQQGKSLYDPKAFTPESWAQFMAGQAPVLPGLMGTYLEQSKDLFVKMQEQMQAGALFPGLPGFGGKR